MNLEATASLRASRPATAPKRSTIIAPVNRAQLRYERAVMLADIRAACTFAWTVTDADDVCRAAKRAAAWDAEVATWKSGQFGALGEMALSEAAAVWLETWSKLDEQHALNEAAFRAGVRGHDDASMEHAAEVKRDYGARMRSPEDAFDAWAWEHYVSAEDWVRAYARYLDGWQYAIDRM